MNGHVSIGTLSKQTGCKIPTIRWYEEQGLLPAAERTEGNQRRYGKNHLTILRFIRHARALGFDLEAIRQLLHLSSCSHHSPHEADEIAKKHLLEVRERIEKLQRLEKELTAMIDACDDNLAHDCRVLTVLSDSGFEGS
ncbi:MAG: MerR family transcriptional regulator [Methyloligellaceae bacterium]